MSWSQILILFLFIGLPAISRGLQSLNDKRNADRERERVRQQRAGNTAQAMTAPETVPGGRVQQHQPREINAPSEMHLPGTHSPENTRRAELAERRAAQLAAWRARQAAAEEAEEAGEEESLQTRVRTPAAMPPARVPRGDLLSAQTGSQLLRSIIETAEQHTQSFRTQPPQPARTGRPTRTGQQQRKNAPASDSDTTVQRLVLSDEEIAAKQGRRFTKKPLPMDGVQQSKIQSAEIHKIISSRAALRQAFILKEILDRPLALRHDL